MKKALIQSSLAFAIALSCAALANSPARAQSTAFTYQGSLDDAGASASGLHDFRFRLFNVPSGGVQIGSTLCVDNVSVIDGVFTAQLDFGQQYATAAQRHLEIEVRRDTGLSCANVAGFVLMTPRQQLTATPIASHANSAFSLDAADGSPASAVFVDNSGNVGIGTTSPQALLHVNGSVRWGGTTTDLGYSGEDASGLFLEQKGSSSATSKIRLQTSKSGDLNNYSQFFIDPNAGFAFTTIGTGNGNVGIGTAAPAAKLDVRGDIRLGPTGQLRAPGAEENLRIVRGIIAADGTQSDGSGFSCSRIEQGRYSVTFTTPFADIPTVTATADRPPPPETGGAYGVMTDLVTSSTLEFLVRNTSGNIWQDRTFQFIAIGPR